MTSPAHEQSRVRRTRAARARAVEVAARGDQLGFELEPARPVAVPAPPRTGPTALPAPVPRLPAVPRDAPREGHTLDAVLTATWGGLLAHESVACPVCRGAMTPRYAAGPRPVGGRCRDCASALA